MHLEHHGIKGQRWGIKHGPPYPIQPGNGVTIKKGTKLKRISRYDESKSEGHAYVNYNKEDIERYKGFFGAMIATEAILQGRKVYVHDIEAAKDLRSPSQQERIDTFIDMYKNDPRIANELAKYHKHGESHANAWLPEFVYRWEYNNLKGDKLKQKGYATFAKSLGGNEYIRNKYFTELKKRGYDFIRDDQDAGVHGNEPSIILDRKVATVYKGASELPLRDIYEHYKKYGSKVSPDKRHKEWES